MRKPFVNEVFTRIVFLMHNPHFHMQTAFHGRITCWHWCFTVVYYPQEDFTGDFAAFNTSGAD